MAEALYVLNFYSALFVDQLKRGRKTATIRLGDKRHKYQKNQLVLVTVGYQYFRGEKLLMSINQNVPTCVAAGTNSACHEPASFPAYFTNDLVSAGYVTRVTIVPPPRPTSNASF